MTLHRTTHANPRRQPRRALVPAALALALLSAPACDDVDIAASLGAPGGTIAIGGQTASAVIGRWLHVEGAAADGYTTETTWTFDAGGSARRTIVTRTVLGEVVAVSETLATWSAGAGVLLIDLGAPSFRVLRVPFSITYGVEGTVLHLDGLRYLRVDS
jgi:hypothetical protein